MQWGWKNSICLCVKTGIEQIALPQLYHLCKNLQSLAHLTRRKALLWGREDSYGGTCFSLSPRGEDGALTAPR